MAEDRDMWGAPNDFEPRVYRPVSSFSALQAERDRYREALGRIARVCGWAPSDGEFAVQIAREALDG